MKYQFKTDISKEEYDKFVKSFPNTSFMQISSWAEVKSAWKNDFVGMCENNKLVCCAMILKRNLFLGKKLFYIPRGFVIDYSNKKLLKEFTNNLKSYAKKNNGIVIKIDPFIALNQDNIENEGITITFVEGKRLSYFIEQISKNFNYTNEEIHDKLNDRNYLESLINKYWFLSDKIFNEDIYEPLEGYLYPETYNFSKNVTIEEIIKTMLDQSDKVFSKYKSLIDESSYSINELVTLASIVESEGIYVSDRKNIAGVFYNRLDTGMPLGSDVTTYYAFKEELGTRDLTKKEINTYNPYNTRGPKMEGKLPVGAISNFSLSSFEAVLEPIDNDYYYFVADNTGKTHFTKNYTEHQKIIKELKNAGKWITF